MESDFKGVVKSSIIGNKLNGMVSSAFSPNGMCMSNLNVDDDDDSDCDEEERELFTRSEVKKLFDVVDSDNSGYISKNELAEMLKQLGRDTSIEKFDEGFKKVDCDNSGQIDFEEFYQWYKNCNNPNS